jgi:hypothetical protein
VLESYTLGVPMTTTQALTLAAIAAIIIDYWYWCIMGP